MPGLCPGQVFQHLIEKDGSSPDRIITIAQDKTGFMWFGTASGLYRYDAHRFTQFLHDPANPKTVISNYTTVISCDSGGALWVGTFNGLSRYDGESGTFQNFKYSPGEAGSISADTVYSIGEDRQKGLWIGTSTGLNRVEMKDGKIRFKRFLQNEAGKPGLAVYGMAAGEGQDLWLSTSEGLARFNQGKIEIFKTSPDPRFPDINNFKSVFKDDSGNIWLGLRPGGLMRFEISSRRFELMEDFKGWDGDWPDVSGFLIDKPGKLWIATMSGLVYFDIKTRRSQWHVNNPTDDQSLGDDAVMCMFRDRGNGIWLGTYHVGLDYLNVSSPVFSRWPFFIDRVSKSKFTNPWMGMTPNQKNWLIAPDRTQVIFYDPATNRTTTHNLNLDFAEGLNHFFIDEHDVLWCGGNRLLKNYDFKKGTRQDYPFPDPKDTPFGRGRIFRIMQDSRQRLWFCGHFGLSFLDKKTKTTHATGVEAVIICIFEDSKGNIWGGGIKEAWFIPNGSGKPEKIAIRETAADETGGYDSVWRITEDRQGRIWLVNTHGLRLFNPGNRQFEVFPKTGGPALDADDIQTDSKGYLWLSKGKNLVRYHPDKGTLQTYSYLDGLPKKSILPVNTIAKDETGRLFFNTSKEMFSLDPDQVSTDTLQAAIAISSLRLFNKEVKPGDGTGILNRQVNREKTLVFRHNQNIFTLDFALLSYSRAAENKYRYRMEGFEKEWHEVSVPSAAYMNLPPGDYTFVVNAANGDGVWNTNPLRLDIVVLPPWWKTWYAYLSYILLIAALVYAVTHFFWLRSSFRRENALNQIKLDFFTNVSHEIRTHLSLITGPLEKAFQNSVKDVTVRNYLTYARNNSDRLMLLVNELLDFRKIQSGSSRLQVGEHDVVRVLKSVVAAFEHIGKEKGIETTLLFPHSPVLLWFDLAQMQKVFYNLLSNAYKFTAEGGRITVGITESSGEVRINVEDNGKGMSEEHLEKLFTYFYQADSEKPGYGIGLALSKAIVEQHHGYLTARSRLAGTSSPGGTTLTIRMLRENRHFSPEQLVAAGIVYGSSMFAETAAPLNGRSAVQVGQSNTILIIEDNDELRAFIREIFESGFNVLEAENGALGLEMAAEHIPDIVLSDVMMPGMNGLEVCSRLKNAAATAHIPVVLLTARTQSDQVVEGLSAGADDYLVKPFDPRILELKINNLIRLRDGMKERYRESVLADHLNGSHIARDVNEAFIARLRELVAENISTPGFGVNELAMQVGMSVSVLYRKMRSLTDMTVNEFVRTIRFSEAKKLLESGVYNVSEVATITGFEDSKYFSKEFRKLFGKNPNEIKKQGPAS